MIKVVKGCVEGRRCFRVKRKKENQLWMVEREKRRCRRKAENTRTVETRQPGKRQRPKETDGYEHGERKRKRRVGTSVVCFHGFRLFLSLSVSLRRLAFPSAVFDSGSPSASVHREELMKRVSSRLDHSGRVRRCRSDYTGFVSPMLRPFYSFEVLWFRYFATVSRRIPTLRLRLSALKTACPGTRMFAPAEATASTVPRLIAPST